MTSLPKSLEITITKEQDIIVTKGQQDKSNKTPEPSKSTTTSANKAKRSDKSNDMLLPPRTPPYRTGAKKEPGTEDEACEDAIASGDATPSWEGVWRKDRQDVNHLGPGGTP